MNYLINVLFVYAQIFTIISQISSNVSFAGLVGTNEVMGYKYRWRPELFTGLGFNGIAVALLGKNHPLGVVLAAILFGILNYGGAIVNIYTERRIPRE
ncbi:unnamed protein product, partial [marine sediment metagenome]